MAVVAWEEVYGGIIVMGSQVSGFTLWRKQGLCCIPGLKDTIHPPDIVVENVGVLVGSISHGSYEERAMGHVMRTIVCSWTQKNDWDLDFAVSRARARRRRRPPSFHHEHPSYRPPVHLAPVFAWCSRPSLAPTTPAAEVPPEIRRLGFRPSVIDSSPVELACRWWVPN